MRRLTFTLDSIRHRGEESGPRKQSHDALTTNAQHGRAATGLNPSTGHRSGRRRAIRIGLGTKVTEGNVAQDDPSRAARAPLSLPLPFPLRPPFAPFSSSVPAPAHPTRCSDGVEVHGTVTRRSREYGERRARHQAHTRGEAGAFQGRGTPVAIPATARVRRSRARA